MNNVYVADFENNRICKITSDGTLSVLAESGKWDNTDDSNIAIARFDRSIGLVVSKKGNLYVSDTYRHRICRITLDGVMSILAGSGKYGFQDGSGSEAQFRCPAGLAVDSEESIYVADTHNQRIRKITSDGIVTAIAGDVPGGHRDGIGVDAKFAEPKDVAIDEKGNLYVADALNHSIRKISRGVVSTLAGSRDHERGYVNDFGAAAQFNYPTGVAVDSAGNVYVVDYLNDRIRKITPEGLVRTLVGSTKGCNPPIYD